MDPELMDAICRCPMCKGYGCERCEDTGYLMCEDLVEGEPYLTYAMERGEVQVVIDDV